MEDCRLSAMLTLPTRDLAQRLKVLIVRQRASSLGADWRASWAM